MFHNSNSPAGNRQHVSAEFGDRRPARDPDYEPPAVPIVTPDPIPAQYGALSMPSVVDRLVAARRISPTQMLIVKQVLNFASAGRQFYVGIAELARSVNRSYQTVANALAGLVSSGLLRRCWRNRRNYLEFQLPAVVQTAVEPLPKTVAVRDPKRDPKQTNHSPGPAKPVAGRGGADPIGVSGVALPARMEPPPPNPPETPRATPVDDYLVPPARITPAEHRTAPAPTEAGYARARRLRAAVVAHTRYAAPWRASAWAREFDRLLAAVNGDSARLDQILVWFCDNISDRYTPQVRSAETFRKRFADVEAARSRHVEKNPPPPDPAADPATCELAQRMVNLNWPAGAAAQVPAVVAASVAAVRAFQARAGALTGPGRGVRLWRHLATSWGPAGHVVEAWMRRVSARVGRWEGWDGQLAYFVWRPDHPDVRRGVEIQAAKYSTSLDGAWAELTREISRGDQKRTS